MKDKLSQMRTMITQWLKTNGIDGDLRFYSIDEWKLRNEDYHNEAELVLVTEGGLHTMLNYGDSDEFCDLVNSFGYYYEFGHSWNLGFYKDGMENSNNKTYNSYSEKLRDYRWQEKRKYILERAENKCEDCASTKKLEIHHCYYLYDFEPWEYPYDSLRCLCSKCHKERGITEKILRGHLASLKNTELESIIELISTGLYWYPREEVFSLLKSFKHNQKKMKEIFSSILSKRIEH